MRSLIDPDRYDTAYHEAGHAVMSCLLGRIPVFATIIPDETGADGYVVYENDVFEDLDSWGDDPELRREILEKRTLITLAGLAAQDLYRPDRQPEPTEEVEIDEARYWIGECLGLESDRDAFLDAAQKKARAILANNWPPVERMATELLIWSRLSRADIRLK